jgi:hypothetical protein
MRKLNDLQVEIGEVPGEVSVTGVLEELDVWKRAKSDIESKTQVKKLIDQVTTPGQSSQIAEAEEKQPEPAPQAEPVQNEPEISTDSFSHPRLPFRIVGFGIGRVRSFKIAPGVRVPEGSEIYGYKVESINSKRIQFTKDDQEIIVHLKR